MLTSKPKNWFKIFTRFPPMDQSPLDLISFPHILQPPVNASLGNHTFRPFAVELEQQQQQKQKRPCNFHDFTQLVSTAIISGRCVDSCFLRVQKNSCQGYSLKWVARTKEVFNLVHEANQQLIEKDNCSYHTEDQETSFCNSWSFLPISRLCLGCLSKPYIIIPSERLTYKVSLK